MTDAWARSGPTDLAGLLRDQSGVVARRQLLDDGLTRVEVARLLRRGDLVVHHPGVYLEHNGPPTWMQRAWAAVLHAWPAALWGESALRAVEGPGRRWRDDAVIDVVIGRDRRLAAVDGVRLHRSAGFPEQVQWSASPPRNSYEEALLDLAAAASDDLAAIGILTDACGSRRTTAARLLRRIGERPRIGRRAWLVGVLEDVATGSCSVLEQGYLERVVRPHGLPEGRRQVPAVGATGRVWRDVLIEEAGLVVELDGATHHTSLRDRGHDLDRDLTAAAGADLATVRLGWTQVFVTQCRTATQLDQILQRRGWPDRAHPCELCGGSDRPG